MQKIILALSILASGCVSAARYQRLEQRLADLERQKGSETESETPDKADARNPPAVSEKEPQGESQPVAVTRRAIMPQSHGPYDAYLTADDCAPGDKAVGNNFCSHRDGGLNCRYERSGRSAHVTWLSFTTTVGEPVTIRNANVTYGVKTLLGPEQKMCVRIGRVVPDLKVSYYTLKPEGFLVPSDQAPTTLSLVGRESFTVDESWPQ